MTNSDHLLDLCLSAFFDEQDRADIAAGRGASPWRCLGMHAAGERHSTHYPMASKGGRPVTWTDAEAEPQRGPMTPEGDPTP